MCRILRRCASADLSLKKEGEPKRPDACHLSANKRRRRPAEADQGQAKRRLLTQFALLDVFLPHLHRSSTTARVRCTAWRFKLWTGTCVYWPCGATRCVSSTDWVVSQGLRDQGWRPNACAGPYRRALVSSWSIPTSASSDLPNFSRSKTTFLIFQLAWFLPCLVSFWINIFVGSVCAHSLLPYPFPFPAVPYIVLLPTRYCAKTLLFSFCSLPLPPFRSRFLHFLHFLHFLSSTYVFSHLGFTNTPQQAYSEYSRANLSFPRTRTSVSSKENIDAIVIWVIGCDPLTCGITLHTFSTIGS